MQSNHAENFEDVVQKMFAFFWETDRLDQLTAKAIPVAQGREGFVVPLCSLLSKDPRVLRWHQQLDQRNCLKIGGNSADWLQSLRRSVSEGHLFQVWDPQGHPVGTLLLRASASRVLSVSQICLESEGHRHLLFAGLKTLAEWAETQFVPLSVELNAQSDAAGLSQEMLQASGFRDQGAGKHVFNLSTCRDPAKEILTAGPLISGREAAYVLDAAQNGWNSGWNTYLKKFTSSFCEYLGVSHALETSSCTGALHLALAALEIGPGDEVIVPEITWVATASAVKYVGATPVFVDVDPQTWCLDPEKFEQAITPKTKCVMPVHLYGHPAEMNRIVEIARRKGLFIVEDAAPSIGAEFQGRKTGTFGDFAAFSFQGAKLLVTGEGGMLVTNNPDLHAKAYALWDHGRKPGTFWINQVGFKYKMSNVQAALGLAQLESVDQQIAAKRRIFGWYESGLREVRGVTLMHEAAWAKSIYWMSSVLLDANLKITREEFCKRLKASGVDTRPAFPKISSYPMWPEANNPVAERIGAWGINLPSGVALSESQVQHVCKSLKQVLGSL